tara:strand:+ start:1009 stop:1176 length:168 start_codon:yes stop_codon:yes gene_type:complete
MKNQNSKKVDQDSLVRAILDSWKKQEREEEKKEEKRIEKELLELCKRVGKRVGNL